MAVQLDTSVQFVKGVGPARAEMFAQAGIRTVEDLLSYKPFRYEDRSNYKKVSDMAAGEEALVEGEILVTGDYTTPMKGVKIFEIMIRDSSGSLSVKFFNQSYLSRVLRKGQRLILFGVPRRDDYSMDLALINPEWELIDSASDAKIHGGRIVPIYRRLGKLTTRMLRGILFRLLADLGSEVTDPLPLSLRQKHGFLDRLSALQEIHFPTVPPGETRESFWQRLESNQTEAHRRLIFEEFFLFQTGLQLIKRQREVLPKTRVMQTGDRLRQALKSVLPFRPSRAQKRVLKEIVDDLCSTKVMSRLLHGDVGSGKTIVALQAIVVGIENGHQTALMAPTEILAEQHFQTFQSDLENTSYEVVLLTSRVKGKKRKAILARIESGEVDLVIGTHALIEQQVEFKDLALVVIDEQHRFGVLQRSRLMAKGGRPDTLVMTATPIPRSLALTVYGDLDLSVLDEMPPGRQPVRTVIKSERSRQEVYNLIRSELKRQRQAFIVYPLIDESQKLDLRAATAMAEHLQQEVFREFKVGLIHGRLKSDEKEELMGGLREGRIQVLVSTTVVEVGIDLPNASVMAIEHAERFGLSQLHQLRGRIGRGRHPGICILMTEGARSEAAYQRLEIMRRTNDGFKIAEKDLEIRGPGEFVGTRQSGLPEFRFGNIVRDREALELAAIEARQLLREMLAEADRPALLINQLIDQWKERYGLYVVG